MRHKNRTSMAIILACIAATFPALAPAQWEIEESHTTASLRGIHNVGAGIAWASGTNGTVLRTEDGGYLWQTCAIPPGAEKLDFRGIQAFDEKTAIVMSSGPGDQSRLYKTTDGCQTWKLLFTNPDKDGFFDSILARLSADHKSADAMIAGDPVNGSFTLFALSLPISFDGPATLMPFSNETCTDKETHRQLPLPMSSCRADLISAIQAIDAEFEQAMNAEREPSKRNVVKPTSIPAEYKSPVPRSGESLFAASNSSLFSDPSVWFRPNIAFVTGGPTGSRFIQYRGGRCDGAGCESWRVADLPFASGESAGAFSLAATGRNYWDGVIVGGDYKNADEILGTGAYTADEGKSWQSSITPPHGYRSAVAYDATTKTWITVGPNGTDISTDDGRNWHPLTPTPQDDKDADKNWNALSLPFVVGPKGRIGKLRTGALTAVAPK